MLISRQPLPDKSSASGTAQGRAIEHVLKAAPQPTEQAVGSLSLGSVVADWSKACAAISDYSGFARQTALASTMQVEQLRLDSKLDASYLEAHLYQQNLEVVHLAFAKLLSIYTGHTTVAFASLEHPADQTRTDAWLLCHCVAKLETASIDATGSYCLDSLKSHLDSNTLWGASLSKSFSSADRTTLSLDRLPLPSTSLHLHLSLNADRQLHIQAFYAPDTLLASDARQICRRFAHLLVQMHAGVSIQKLDTLVPGELDLILGQYSRSQQQLESGRGSPKAAVLVHRLISQTSQRFRSSIAIHSPSSKAEITYEQLGASSDRLACQLRRLDVGPEVHTAAMLEKSELLPIAILAILKAGGCVTPMVDQIPDDRICHIINETRPPVWIVDAANAPRAERIVTTLASEVRPKLLKIGHELHSSKEPLMDLIALRDVNILPTTKAYTIYTSGSTGVPKAVILEHRNLASFAAAKVDGWNIGPGSRLLQFSAPVWDVSLGDFLYALTTGATLVLQDRFDAITDIDATIDTLQITHAILTPTVADFIRQRHCRMEALILTGEAVPLAQRDRLLSLVPALLNGGAPSEVTILALMNQLSADDALLRWTPFGRPIGSVQSVIVDALGAVVPIGGVGELCLGGDQVSRGYLNQPEKTQAVFVDLAIIGMPQQQRQRFYRTGDLTRLHADGRFELLGRVDGQLKYRGVRLEAQEIQNAIQRADERIEHAFVCTRTIRNTPRLVALVQLTGNETLSGGTMVQQLVERVRAKLGAAATPNVFIAASCALPLTVTGKLDRRALQVLVDNAIASNQLHIVTSSSKPSTSEEAHTQDSARLSPAIASSKAQLAVAEAFGSALELDPREINIHESLDGLGGDSLTAVRILTHLRKRGAKIEIRDLVQSGGGTVAQVAARTRFDEDGTAGAIAKVDAKLAELTDMDRDWVLWRYAIQADWLEDMYYSTPYQSVSSGMGFAFKLPRPQSIEWNQAVWECTGATIHADSLRSAWMATVQQHSNFRSAMAYTAKFEGVVCIFKPNQCPFDLATFYPVTDAEHDRDFHSYMDQDRLRGHIDFGRVPFRLALIGATANRGQKLIIAFPHSLACGWSMRLMLKDLLCHLNGRSSEVQPTPATSFKDYIAFTRNRDLESLEQTWIDELKPLEFANWPVDFEKRPATMPVVNRQYDCHVSLDTKQLSKSLGVSLFTITMTAFVLALARRIQKPDEAASRVQVSTSYIASSRFFDGLKDLESIRGPTLDLVLACFQIELDESVQSLLQRSSVTISRTKGKEHLPMHRVVKWKGMPKIRSALQTSIIFQNLPGLEASGPQETSIGLGREHMATSACIFLQVTPSADKLTLRTAFDERLVSSDEAHAFVDDMRCLIEGMAGCRANTVRELLAAMPGRAKAIATLPRPQPLEHFDLPPVGGGFWLQRLVRNLWCLLWYHVVLWPIRKRRL